MAYDLLKKCVSLVFNLMNILLGGKLPPFGSAGIIVEEEDRYLVVVLPHGRITFPGGFMTWHEHPCEAAEREGYEETGLRLQADDLINFYSLNSTHWLHMSNLSFVYHGRILSGQLCKSAEGVPCWLAEAELRTRLDPHGLTVLEDYLRYRERKQQPPAA
jgi:ADP-ribose pyrophosphatase